VKKVKVVKELIPRDALTDSMKEYTQCVQDLSNDLANISVKQRAMEDKLDIVLKRLAVIAGQVEDLWKIEAEADKADAPDEVAETQAMDSGEDSVFDEEMEKPKAKRRKRDE